MKRIRRKHLAHTIHAIMQWCGVAGILGGVLFVAWGYIDEPNISDSRMAVIDILAFAVPTLFLGSVVGLFVLWETRVGTFGWLGMALAVYGLWWGIVSGIAGGEYVWRYFVQKGWPHYLHNWLLFMLTGLTLVSFASIKEEPLSKMGALVLTMATSGWVYYLTDTNAIFEARSVHVGFGVLFSGCWVAMGVGLLMAGIKRAQRPRV